VGSSILASLSEAGWERIVESNEQAPSPSLRHLRNNSSIRNAPTLEVMQEDCQRRHVGVMAISGLFTNIWRNLRGANTAQKWVSNSVWNWF
jgi:hypothetical protein